ncbi:MAG: T9SS type A sorting domain-containing protein, partial [Bacteroidota bacterium]
IFVQKTSIGNEGCTPGFWKNTENWCGTYQKTENFYVIFGITNTRNLGALTLVEALDKNGGGYAKLARHATAALLNSCNQGVNYSYSIGQIIAEVREIFNNPALSKFNAEKLGDLYDLANNLGCPLNNSNKNEDKDNSSADVDFNKVQAYPNPLQADGVWIQFNRVERKEKYSAIIFDFNGRKLAERSFEVDPKNTKHFWNLDHGTWGQGVFIVRLKSGNKEYQIRLIK